MGVETRKPPLPAPTESSFLQTSGGSVTGTDLATDVSRRTDRTSYSIPEDGSPVTISTKKRKEKRDREQETTLTRASHQSQTSLLIEYFEAGKGPNVHSRPSVRVKVTPSAARKIKDTNEHIQITEAGGSRKPSYTRRISLGPKGTNVDKQTTEGADDRSVSSYTSAAEESSLAGRYPPVEIEVLHKDQDSDLSSRSAPREQRYSLQNLQNPSEISSMPPDSMLEGDGNAGNLTPKRHRSRSVSRGAVRSATDTLKTPSRRRSRSLSKERLTQKVIEKLEGKSRQSTDGRHKHSSKSRSRNVSREQLVESPRSSKRRSSRQHHEEELPSGAESSLLTSQMSPTRKSGDQYSFRSGTSKSSINNPKLLETVEDAIRRLILPELTTLKQEQKMNQNRNRFERDRRDSVASGSSITREEITRRPSKHASAPDVKSKPKVVLNRDENNAGTVLSGNSIKGRKESKRDKRFDSPSERSLERDISQETVVRDGEKVSRKRSKDGHRIRDVAAAGVAGGILTAAALRHHDSKSSVDKKERRRRSSKSHSRSVSYAGSTEEIFSKHDVPPMPMRSEIQGSELTRDSILSEHTEEPSTPPSERRRQEIREVSRGSPREILSPASRTPNRTPVSLHRGLVTHHSNFSRGDLSVHSARSDRSLRDQKHHSNMGEDTLVGAAAGAGALTTDKLSHDRYYDDNGELRVHSRALSPIQSVASYKEESEPPIRDSRQTRSSGSLSIEEPHGLRSPVLSIKSLSSAASTNIARSNRPKGINLEDGETILEPHNFRDSKVTRGTDSPSSPGMDDWYERQHEENDRYRDSMAESSNRDSMIDVKHMTNYTDDSLDAPYLDKVTAAQQVRGMGANPEYIHTPVAVESAVASLHDPSILSVRSRPGDGAYTESLEGEQSEEPYQHKSDARGLGLKDAEEEYREQQHTESSSPQKSYKDKNHEAADSPRQSVAGSISEHEEPIHLGTSGLPIAEDPMPEIGHGLDSDSDLNTNPSIIQGPIGGRSQENRDHWPYQPTPPQNKGEFVSQSNGTSAHESLKAAAAGFMSAAALASQDRISRGQQVKSREQSREQSLKNGSRPVSVEQYEQAVNHDFGPNRDSYMNNQPIPTPPMAKDEGYVSAHQPRSAGQTPDLKDRVSEPYDPNDVAGFGGLLGEDDPFVGKTHTRHLSSNSHGMPSPLYDSATGGGIDRIQSKDIVALMDHVSCRLILDKMHGLLTDLQLTVRDAQRNARDTEILVTLVRSAAEMRNSFEEMKKFIAEQDDMVLDTGNKQHDRTVQKIIGGPRPQPLGTPRFPRRSSAEDEYDEKATKRQNVFKRALKGLGTRNANDLSKIEDMLMQLLGDVESLKTGQDVRPSIGGTRAESFNSYNDLRAAGQDGYEPEGQAGTSSTGHSGYFSEQSPSRRPGAMRSQEGRRGSQNRVSTVLEDDEELEAHEQNVLSHQFENNEQLRTPTKDYTQADSVTLGTPPQVHIPTGANSNDHTPKSNTDKSRKHKSTSSSFFPKISRWSKTTASSVGDNFRSSAGPRQRPFSEASRSGSDLNYNAAEHYDPQGDDRLRSSDSFDVANIHHADEEEENRPPSPLIPSQVSTQVSEGPKYQAHRDSQNLQHPQPRPGPTHRYQTALESQAHDFGSPISPTSDQWGSNPSLARFAPGAAGNRHSGGAGNLSPISDAGYSETSATGQSAAGPPRPPKIRDEGPLVPGRPPKVEMARGGSYEGVGAFSLTS